MDEKLPEEVDVIVLGTGLPEAILASACSRAGLSVLHLDRNEYYGGDWTSFTMSMIHELQQDTKTEPIDENLIKIDDENEKITILGDRKTISDLKIGWKSEEVELERKKQLEGQLRKFSIDLVPKVLLSKGAMVQTLCDSQVSHYAEFKLVNRQLCPIDSGEIEGVKLHPVPCSKGEIFQSQVLSILEKRALMKFITFCTQWSAKEDGEKERIVGDGQRPFSAFLTEMGVTGALQTFIISTLGILAPQPSTLQGLRAACQFMDSVGHFGPSPFLFPLYGCGELSQCFCRLAAVFGSLYCLGRPVQAILENRETGGVIGVIADNQRVNLKAGGKVIMAPRYVPEHFGNLEKSKIRRLIYATDKSIDTRIDNQITLINLASLRPFSEISRLLEVGFEACTAPKGHFLVHATGSLEAQDRDETIENVVERIFKENDVTPYWSMSFTANSLEFSEQNHLSNGIIVAPPVDAQLDYAGVIEKCRQIFRSAWPDLDFLPRSIAKNDENEEENENLE